MEENNVLDQNSNESEEVVLEATEETAPEENAEEAIDWKAKALKAEEVANNQRIRAEKAERLNKVSKTEAPKAQTVSLSNKDFLALVNAKINEEDIGEVEDFAKYKGISIADALKSSALKSLLRDKEESRRVANASNTGKTRQGSSKVSEDILISKAQKGELPDSDDDIIRMIKARKGLK